MQNKILEVTNLNKHFSSKKSLFSNKEKAAVRAVDGVNFYINEGETMGLVGESGCGKTTTGKAILGLSSVTSGSIKYRGTEIANLKQKEFKHFRKEIQMIFQDLDAALNPKMKVADLIREAILVHQPDFTKQDVKDRTDQLLNMVNLKKSQLTHYPSELSGGEKRRVGLARTLAIEPKFIVADEPTSALDVSIQAQVVNLLRDLQDKLGLTYLFISHDLPLVQLVSHYVGVMYLGKMVETGPAEIVTVDPKHPYTAVLWSSIVSEGSKNKLKDIKVNIGDWDIVKSTSVAGCSFAPRCPVFAARGKPDICVSSTPDLLDLGSAHRVACHFPL